MVLANLVSCPDLNGRAVEVKQRIPSTGRVLVHVLEEKRSGAVESPPRVLAIRAENLQVKVFQVAMSVMSHDKAGNGNQGTYDDPVELDSGSDAQDGPATPTFSSDEEWPLGSNQESRQTKKPQSKDGTARRKFASVVSSDSGEDSKDRHQASEVTFGDFSESCSDNDSSGPGLKFPSELQQLKAHIRQLSGNVPPGTCNVGSTNGANATVFAVGHEAVFWPPGLARHVLLDPRSFAESLGMPCHISQDPPVHEDASTKYLVHWADCNRPLRDLYTKGLGSWKNTGWTHRKNEGTSSKVLTDTSTLSHKHWEERIANLKKKPEKCPCVECRHPNQNFKKFQMKITVLTAAFTSSGCTQLKSGTFILLEYKGDKEACDAQPHGNAHDRQSVYSRVFPSVRKEAFDLRAANTKKPIQIQADSLGNRDPRRFFKCPATARQACRYAASPGGDLAMLIEMLTNQSTLATAGVGVKSLQRVVGGEQDIIVAMWTDESLQEAQALAAGDGVFLHGASPIYMDPKFGTDGWFMMEIIARRVYLEWEPSMIAAVFFFKRTTTSTMTTCQSLLLDAGPDLKHAQWANTDGDRRLATAIRLKYPLADHGVDKNHAIQNITAEATALFGMPKTGWSTKIRKELETVFMEETPLLAAGALMEVLAEWPPKLKSYVIKNKMDILLCVIAKPALVQTGRVREDGTPVAPETQTSESNHSLGNRRIEGNTNTIRAQIDVVARLFQEQANTQLKARLGLLKDKKLKAAYSHLSLQSRQREYQCLADASKFSYHRVSLADMIGAVTLARCCY